MKDNIPARPTQAPEHIRVTVVRIFREWSHADDTPFCPDDVDRLVLLASRAARVRSE